MPSGRNRAELQKLIAAGADGLSPDLLLHLPRPLSAPPIATVDGASASELEARDLEAIRKESEADRLAETNEERKERAQARELAASYVISDELLHAVQVALLLRQPLLLTGDPGVGKTRFARALAGRLGTP